MTSTNANANKTKSTNNSVQAKLSKSRSYSYFLFRLILCCIYFFICCATFIILYLLNDNTRYSQIKDIVSSNVIINEQGNENGNATDDNNSYNMSIGVGSETSVYKTIADQWNVTVNFDELLKLNSHTAAFINYRSIGLSEPVVFDSANNDFYINHNFVGNDSQIGTIFADVNTPPDPRTTNFIVIYGHNLQSGKMFGNISDISASPSSLSSVWNNKLFDVDSVKQGIVELATTYGTFFYEIVAFDTVLPSNEIFNCRQNFNLQTMAKFVDNCVESKNGNAKVQSSKSPYGKYLLLSTCADGKYNQRFVVLCRLIQVKA